MRLIAHRGCDGQYPENTVRAIRSAAPHVDLVEVDVTRCGSGELVLYHDEKLERVTGVAGRIADTRWDRLAELEVHGSGDGIPRFVDALEDWPAGTAMNLDVTEAGVVPDALTLAAGLEEEILLSSTDPAALEAASAAADRGPDELTLGYSFVADPEANVERARSLGCGFVHVHHRLCLETDLVDLAHGVGLRVDAWTIETPDLAIRLRDLGVDAITVARHDLL